MSEMTKAPRGPYFWEAVLSMLALVGGISSAIVFYEQDPHIPMLLGVMVACIIGLRAGYSWHVIQEGMIGGVTNALQAVIILMIIGILIGIWIMSGVVPTLLYYGLQALSPSYFLAATLVICSITSLATGSSWGTTGTLGIAFMGIGSGLGLPEPIVAGAVLSGAYFGDKMSPLSDTTNLAPAMVGTDLYTHIKHMTYTTSVSIGLTLVLFVIIGLGYGADHADLSQIEVFLTALNDNFVISPVFLIPPVLVCVVSYFRVPAIPGITIGALSAAILGVMFQGNGYGDFLDVALNGFSPDTGVGEVDELLAKGGMLSMMYTVAIIVVAMMFGGVAERTGQMRVVVQRLLERAKSTGSLIASSALTGIAANLLVCDQYMAIVMSGRMFAQEYRDRGLHPKNLSRAVEDSATVTANLVPWNSGGAYQSGVLGVATLAYLPFNFFCWLSPLVTILFGYMGWTIQRIEDDPDSVLAFAAADAEDHGETGMAEIGKPTGSSVS
ncbi:Na+/H+ antiporter NhaC [Paracoccus methylarcula]|uniref:Na+/H+ antiporter NhaC n=1 Tax=Paracoccus methylarcula TaxID=72022 RepID=A0A3R7SCL0_9RHOB|nr:Na+/H+ antiporter NhaC [Paracoccus methylarcula]RNF34167.1 Na+/H+ antiporter NhaC [Paracoccus methylarcula]